MGRQGGCGEEEMRPKRWGRRESKDDRKEKEEKGSEG
jgi:hypothetical protein